MKLLTRREWGATYDVTQRPAMRLPVAQAFIHHTVTDPTTDPAADMRAVERIDIGRFGYPSYSWVIHPTGVVLEGMGTHIGAHTKGNNSTSFGISFLGNFENDQPTPAALDACAALLAARMAQGHLTPGFALGGHRDVFATACPGAHLYPLIGQIRADVTAPPPPDQPHQEDVKVLHLIQGDKKPEWYVTDFLTKRYVGSPDEAARIIYATTAAGGKIAHGPNNGPNIVPQADVDAIKPAS